MYKTTYVVGKFLRIAVRYIKSFYQIIIISYNFLFILHIDDVSYYEHRQ